MVSDSIGVGTLHTDGTITMRLRAETGATVGESHVSYRRGDAHYDEVRAHLERAHGTLEVGVEFVVPAFPD